jgi:coenzyme F420-0:L-glutamate ligase/coenzyme F420-1:gamma-L-glutamate ligase
LTSTDLHDFLRTRRSIRRFKPDPVPDSVIERILTTATYAPSAHNRQPWRFAVLTAPKSKTQLADAMASDFKRDLLKDGLSESEITARIDRSRSRITGAPAVIILCMDASEMDTYPDSHRKQAEHLMAVQSVAAAGLQLLLAAHAEGLGGVWTCGPLFVPETVQQALELPRAWEPQAMFFIGYPDELPKDKELKPLDEVAIEADRGRQTVDRDSH